MPKPPAPNELAQTPKGEQIAEETKQPKRSIFEGIWIATLTKQGSEDDRKRPIYDALDFSNGQFNSHIFAQNGFKKAPYSSKKDALQSSFSVTQTNNNGETLNWGGLTSSNFDFLGRMEHKIHKGTVTYVIDAQKYDSASSPVEGKWHITLKSSNSVVAASQKSVPIEDDLYVKDGKLTSKWVASQGFEAAVVILQKGALAPNSFEASHMKSSGEDIRWQGFIRPGQVIEGYVTQFKPGGRTLDLKFTGTKADAHQ